jgi:hypothetical protein
LTKIDQYRNGLDVVFGLQALPAKVDFLFFLVHCCTECTAVHLAGLESRSSIHAATLPSSKR